jgi:hypothetical protein
MIMQTVSNCLVLTGSGTECGLKGWRAFASSMSFELRTEGLLRVILPELKNLRHVQLRRAKRSCKKGGISREHGENLLPLLTQSSHHSESNNIQRRVEED